jgi:predicted nucleic acid-binding protein
MIVVSDTSPLTALLTVGEAELLGKLFGEVIIPQEVCKELARSHSSLPTWIREETVKNPGKL